MKNIKLNMSNSSNQSSTPSNTAEIVKNIGWVKNTPLRLSNLECRIGAKYFYNQANKNCELFEENYDNAVELEEDE